MKILLTYNTYVLRIKCQKHCKKLTQNAKNILNYYLRHILKYVK